MASPPAPRLNARTCDWLQRCWSAVGFDQAGVSAALGTPEGGFAEAASAEDHLPLWLWRTRAPIALHAFIRLFLLGRPVPLSWAEAALGPLGRWVKLGLARQVGHRLWPQVSLSFHEGTPLLADVPFHVRRASSDHVMGATNATLVLERCLMPAPGGIALDLGTGAGLLALRLAKTARQVVGSDINPRALGFARSNARLAGLANVQFVRADGFKSLPRTPFDLVVGNLPFVISPERRFVYRDGGAGKGAAPDAFSASLVNQAGRHLRPRGHAQFLSQWVHAEHDMQSVARREQAEEEHLATWVAGNGCHALFLRFETQPIVDYALAWSKQGHEPPDARARRVGRWMTFYERARIGAISTGLVVLRKARAGQRPWMLVEGHRAPQAPCGEALLRHVADLEASAARRAR